MVKRVNAKVRNWETPIANCEYVNEGDWFGKCWLIEIGVGYFSLFYVVEADAPSDAIDALVDSEFGHILKTDELCAACEVDDHDNCQCTYAGNFGERVNLDNVYIKRCEVIE